MFRTHLLAFASLIVVLSSPPIVAEDPPQTVRIWPADPPKWTPPRGEEGNQSGPDSRQVAGRSVVRIGNVKTPELFLYPAPGASTTVIICPGGGFSILAWDLEGTEVAERLQQNGVSVAVLKYRVPTGQEEINWVPPVQDLQRSLALIRGGAIESLRSKNVGVLGFSAGGHTAARAALATERLYSASDKYDQASVRPDFAVLIYPAYLTEDKSAESLAADVKVTDETPPMFFAHAFDDSHSCMGSVGLFAELKRRGIPSSLHVFSAGGHGFGARDTDREKDLWLPLLMGWINDRGF